MEEERESRKREFRKWSLRIIVIGVLLFVLGVIYNVLTNPSGFAPRDPIVLLLFLSGLVTIAFGSVIYTWVYILG